MKTDYNSILEIKNGNIRKEEFFKNKLKESIKKLNLKDINEETLINEVFKEALDTYTENTPILFIYHMNGILANKTDNNFNYKLTDKEEVIVYSLMKKENGKFLTNELIIAKNGITKEELENIFEKMDKIKEKNKEYYDEFFKNYHNIMEQRKKYFKDLVTISDDDLEMLGYFIGYNNKKELSIEEIASLYGLSEEVARKKIVHIFKLLKYKNNQEKLLDRFQRQDISKVLGEKANKLRLRLNFYELRAVERKTAKDVIEVKEDKNKKKKRSYQAYTLTEDDINFIKILKKKFNKEIDAFETVMLYTRTTDYFNYKFRCLFKKLDKYENLKEEALKIFPNLYEVRTLSTIREQQIIEELIRQEKEDLSNEEIAKKLNYKSSTEFGIFRNKLYRKIADNSVYKEEIMKLYPELFEVKSYLEYIDESKQADIALSYTYFLQMLDKTITNNKVEDELKKKALEIYKILKENKNLKLSKKLTKTIATINRGYIDNLSILEIIGNTSYDSLEGLINEFYDKIIGIKYSKYNPNNITSENIMVLKDLYTPNSKGYDTQEEIGDKHHTSSSVVFKIKESILTNIENNVLRNNIESIWPTYQEDIIIKNNFNKFRSVLLDKDDLNDMDNLAKSNNIIEGLSKLQESVYGAFASTRDINDQILLAFRLGFFNKHPFTSREIAEMLKIDEDYIINLTKECLIETKDNLTQKESRKIKI